MKNLSIKHSLFFALLCIIPLILSSCLETGENQVTSRVQIGLELQSFDDTLRAGQDSIIIEETRLILGESFFLNSEGDTLFFNQRPGQIDFNQQPQSRNPLPLVSGPFPQGTYEQIKLMIPKAPTDSPGAVDPDFIDGDIRYTLIVDGTYNGEAFTYKSERVLDLEFPFQPAITVPEFNQVFTFLITNDVAGWFLSGNGLLDPRVPENSTEINDNIEQLFTLEVPE